MDRLIYLAMSGAKQTLNQQASVSNNLANVNTNGFRAEISAFRSAPIIGDGAPTRAFVVDSTPGSDYKAGPIQHTGRELDIAVQDQGWLAVQAKDGTEAYTRAGALRLNENGVLQTPGGHPVMGDAGPLSIPPDTLVTIASDGTISTVGTDSRPTASTVVGRIKLVNPPEAELLRGDDGLFRLRDSTPAPADPNVRVLSGALEGSNVNPVDAMVDMITLARQFDLQIKMLQNADANARAAAQLLAVS